MAVFFSLFLLLVVSLFLLVVSILRGISDCARVCDRVVGRDDLRGDDVLVKRAGSRREPDLLVGRQL
jgi:hypothetical protein